MQPAVVQTIRDQILWQYARLFLGPGTPGSRQVSRMSRFTRLRDGEMLWSATIREWLEEHEHPGECIYCGARGPLGAGQLIPRSAGGPDTADNTVQVCRSCSTSKGNMRLYEWQGIQAEDEIPPVAEAKYLKLLYDLHEKRGTLYVNRNELAAKLCPICNEKPLCIEADTVEEMTPYCLEGLLHS